VFRRSWKVPLHQLRDEGDPSSIDTSTVISECAAAAMPSHAARFHNLATTRVAMRRNVGARQSWASTYTPSVNVITELARITLVARSVIDHKLAGRRSRVVARDFT
jgi:hypothetical protein